MRTSNLATEAVRQSEVGQTWEEKLSGAAGTLVLKPRQTFRVRAAAAVTITIDGILAATMISGEILIFNCGSGQPIVGLNTSNNQANQSTVVVTGTAFVQVARDNNRYAG